MLLLTPFEGNSKRDTKGPILIYFNCNISKFSANIMAKSTLRLDTRRVLKDGTYPVQIAVGHGTNIYLGTGIYVSPEDWNSTTHQYIGKGSKIYNTTLVSMLTMVTTRILELKETGQWPKLSRAQIRQMLTHLDLSTPTADIPTLADIFNAMMVGRRENTKGTVRSTRQKIKAFCGKDIDCIKLDDITRGWIEDFYHSMPDLAINSKSTYMRVLRRAINYALDRDMIVSNPFRHYHIPTEETRMRVLSVEKMRQLIRIETQYRYTEYRDMFLLTFYLIGINTVDLSELTQDSVIDGRIEYRRAKTGKLYSIKIEPEAADIIERYRGKKHLLRCFDRCSDYKAYQGTMNNALARIGCPKVDNKGKAMCASNGRIIMQPLEKDLSIYWARYSWATYAAELDIPKDTISEALGHSHGAKVTGVYIKYNRDKIDAANRKVMDYVLYGENS